MNKKPQISDTYDEMYTSQGDEGAYTLPYMHSCYYPLYKEVRKTLIKHKSQDILEVGCGSGGLSHYLFDTTNIKYHGFDFSPVAVEKAKLRTKKTSDFCIGDATDSNSYKHSYDTIVCTEVLEHVEADLEIIQNWKAGTFCICSVPNFDSPYHVRHFNSKIEVLNRYSELLDIQNITALKKPILEDISFSNRLKHIRWNRYKPTRMIELFGFGKFEKVGGWFLFSGYKK